MPVIKITQKGWEKFDGELEGVQFKGGVSVEAMSYMSAERLGCSMSIVDAETEKPVSSTQRILDNQDEGIPAGRYTSYVTKKEDAVEGEEPEVEAEDQEAEADKKSDEFPFSRADLEAIADKGGITELREFAKTYKVNSNSIVGIIDGLMQKKG